MRKIWNQYACPKEKLCSIFQSPIMEFPEKKKGFVSCLLTKPFSFIFLQVQSHYHEILFLVSYRVHQ